MRAGAKRSYTSARLGLFGTMPLPGGAQIQARFNGQLSRDALVPGEQFGLGGASTVRGYEERELVGDSGYVGTVEIYSPDFGPRLGERVKTARVLAFVDGGHVLNRQGLPCLGNSTSCYLASVGVGFQLGAGPLSLRLDMAQSAARGGHHPPQRLPHAFQRVVQLPLIFCPFISLLSRGEP